MFLCYSYPSPLVQKVFLGHVWLVRFHESDKALKIPSEMEVHRALYCLYTVHTAYIASNAQSVYTVFTVQTAYTAYTVACMPLYS